MQQLEALRTRASGSWFRVGLVSTTVVAPLIARWSDLRSAKRDLRLREEVPSRLEALRGGVPARVESLRTLVAQGPGARALDRLASSLPVAEARRKTRSDSVRVGLWLAGVGVGLVAAGAGAYFLAQRRLAASAEEPLLELPTNKAPHNGVRPSATDGRATTAPTHPSRMDGAGAGENLETGAPEPTGNRSFATTADEATFVGNIHTMVFHQVRDEEHLPAEENRVYFASEEEARAAGFRQDRGEMAPSPEVGLTNAEEPTA
ncbi:MAG: hypothetical protein IVW57_05305 [Ktedonobacterales bacterium]|nr:hypothetical protein [Ktedonobacterales bacterium]